MRDDNGYFARYKQCLYFARLQADLLDEVERGEESGTGDLGSDKLRNFDAQRQLCFAEAAVSNLFRAACFLACSVVPPSEASKILRSPRSLTGTLAEAIAVEPSASMQSLYQQLIDGYGQEAGGESDRESDYGHGRQGRDAESLAQLIGLYPSLWSAAQPSTNNNLISVRQFDFSATQCRAWLEQLGQLGRLIVDLETES